MIRFVDCLRIVGSAAALIALCLSTADLAIADQTKDIAGCAEIENSVSRLECFDSLAKRLGVAEPKRRASTIAQWHSQTRTSQVDDTKTVFVYTEADAPISGWPRASETPTLFLRCESSKTDVYIVTGMSPQVEYGRDGATVTLRFDKTKAFRTIADKSTDGKALFLKNPISLIKRMMKHSSMLFQFTPFNSNPQTTTFDVTGASDAVSGLRKACKW